MGWMRDDGYSRPAEHIRKTAASGLDIMDCWFSRLIFCEESEAAMNLNLESGSPLNKGASETGLA
jgi:hypothetical protein